jgi:hypothetical protein
VFVPCIAAPETEPAKKKKKKNKNNVNIRHCVSNPGYFGALNTSDVRIGLLPVIVNNKLIQF